MRTACVIVCVGLSLPVCAQTDLPGPEKAVVQLVERVRANDLRGVVEIADLARIATQSHYQRAVGAGMDPREVVARLSQIDPVKIRFEKRDYAGARGRAAARHDVRARIAALRGPVPEARDARQTRQLRCRYDSALG
jgi:hypothetical protein